MAKNSETWKRTIIQRLKARNKQEIHGFHTLIEARMIFLFYAVFSVYPFRIWFCYAVEFKISTFVSLIFATAYIIRVF